MPVGYLIAVGLVAVATLLALAPIRRPPALGRLNWVLSFLINELPFVAIAWLVVDTALAFSQGDVDSSAGWAVFGLAGLAASGLAVVAWRGYRAGPVVEAALRDGLGADWRTALDPTLARALRGRRPYGRIVFLPLAVRGRDVARVADISYGDAGARNRLDVYHSRSGATGGPVLVYLHGGGFRGGRKDREARPLIHRLARQGWLCVSASYRLQPAAGYPESLADARSVVAWVRAHAHEYGADPETVFVSGSSAGAHLAATMALTDDTVAGAVCLYGYYGQVHSAGPGSAVAAHVGGDRPPFFVTHGENDTYVPVSAARDLVQRLRSASANPVVYAELPGGQHSFDLFHSLRFEAVVDGVEAFAAWVRSRPVG